MFDTFVNPQRVSSIKFLFGYISLKWCKPTSVTSEQYPISKIARCFKVAIWARLSSVIAFQQLNAFKVWIKGLFWTRTVIAGGSRHLQWEMSIIYNF